MSFFKGSSKYVKIQFFVLLGGTLFAWTNFAIELIDWLELRKDTFGCSETTNPFLTPCFFGALFFLLAFLLSFKMVREERK